ncbi:MFS transporter [Agathobacter sp.]|uniref:MFS transporter n=1 Tax=Agathobacter sp. TaxID=2021311 RepID=UPI003FD784EE
MRNFNIKRQINKLYTLTTVSYFRIAGASWVALLALRGFSLLQIGVLESIFHIASSCFEIPSGVVADVFGRKKTLALSKLVSVLSSLAMILSDNFGTVAFAIAFSAISYNLESGTIEALAYDSLKSVKQEEKYNQYASTEMMLYRITSSTATLCAGVALWLGYKKAYAIDIFFGMIALGIACSLREISGFTNADSKRTNSQTDKHKQEQIDKQKQGQTDEHKQEQMNEEKNAQKNTQNIRISERLQNVVTESWYFMKHNRKTRSIMFVNALIGAVSTLVLFFLQAKLPTAGLNEALLGPALFIVGLGAALGAKVVGYFPNWKYRKYVILSGVGVLFAFTMTFTGNPYIMIAGGFAGSFADDFLEVRTDILLNDMIPSEQRATLMSVNSFTFSLVMIVMSTLMGSIM